jgi:hypothetical protein
MTRIGTNGTIAETADGGKGETPRNRRPRIARIALMGWSTPHPRPLLGRGGEGEELRTCPRIMRMGTNGKGKRNLKPRMGTDNTDKTDLN